MLSDRWLPCKLARAECVLVVANSARGESPAAAPRVRGWCVPRCTRSPSASRRKHSCTPRITGAFVACGWMRWTRAGSRVRGAEPRSCPARASTSTTFRSVVTCTRATSTATVRRAGAASDDHRGSAGRADAWCGVDARRPRGRLARGAGGSAGAGVAVHVERAGRVRAAELARPGRVPWCRDADLLPITRRVRAASDAAVRALPGAPRVL